MFKGSIPALVTPMRQDGAIDFDAWERLLDFHLESGSDAVVVGGTTGESPALERAELEDLIRRARRASRGGSRSSRAVARRARRRASRCRAPPRPPAPTRCCVVTPYYNRPTQEGLYRHFTAIADAVSVPLILYNVPGRTACDLLPETVGRLSQHPRIVGHQGGDRQRRAGRARCCGRSRPGFLLISGDDATAARPDARRRLRRDLGDGQRRALERCTRCARRRCAARTTRPPGSTRPWRRCTRSCSSSRTRSRSSGPCIGWA